MRTALITTALLAALAVAAPDDTAAPKAGPNENHPPAGFTALFNGKDLTGWQALIEVSAKNATTGKTRRLPLWLAGRSPEAAAKIQKQANAKLLPHWTVLDGILHYDGKGTSLQTIKNYADFEMYVSWKIRRKGDSGIYLRGNPQVQIWDNPLGSGGLYNNQKHPSNPLKVADKPIGQWNTFHIVMKGDVVTVHLNKVLVVDQVPMENYWDRGQPLPRTGPIELQHHGDQLWFKNIYVRELPTPK